MTVETWLHVESKDIQSESESLELIDSNKDLQSDFKPVKGQHLGYLEKEREYNRKLGNLLNEALQDDTDLNITSDVLKHKGSVFLYEPYQSEVSFKPSIFSKLTNEISFLEPENIQGNIVFGLRVKDIHITTNVCCDKTIFIANINFALSNVFFVVDNSTLLIELNQIESFAGSIEKISPRLKWLYHNLSHTGISVKTIIPDSYVDIIRSKSKSYVKLRMMLKNMFYTVIRQGLKYYGKKENQFDNDQGPIASLAGVLRDLEGFVDIEKEYVANKLNIVRNDGEKVLVQIEVIDKELNEVTNKISVEFKIFDFLVSFLDTDGKLTIKGENDEGKYKIEFPDVKNFFQDSDVKVLSKKFDNIIYGKIYNTPKILDCTPTSCKVSLGVISLSGLFLKNCDFDYEPFKDFLIEEIIPESLNITKGSKTAFKITRSNFDLDHLSRQELGVNVFYQYSLVLTVKSKNVPKLVSLLSQDLVKVKAVFDKTIPYYEENIGSIGRCLEYISEISISEED